MGCDSTGRRRSARLNTVDTIAVPETVSVPARSGPSLGSGSSLTGYFTKSIIAQKYRGRSPPVRGICLPSRNKSNGAVASPSLTNSPPSETHTTTTDETEADDATAQAPPSQASTVEDEPAAHSPTTAVQPPSEDAAAHSPPTAVSLPSGDAAAKTLPTAVSPPSGCAAAKTLPTASSPPSGDAAAHSPTSGGQTEARPAEDQTAPGQDQPITPDPQMTTPEKTSACPDAEPQCPTEGLEASNLDSEQSSTPHGPFPDDGRRKCRLRVSLRELPEARLLSGLELDKPASGVTAGKRKRTTKGKENEKEKEKEKEKGVRHVRGPGKPRDPAEPADRPALIVVGDKEFWCEPNCTKVVPTTRILTLQNLPRPFRSYNMFPSTARLEILRQFL